MFEAKMQQMSWQSFQLFSLTSSIRPKVLNIKDAVWVLKTDICFIIRCAPLAPALMTHRPQQSQQSLMGTEESRLVVISDSLFWQAELMKLSPADY